MKKFSWIILILLACSLFFIACDSRDATSAKYVITVSSDPDTLHLGSEINYTTIEAAITKDGIAMSNALIEFSSDKGTIIHNKVTDAFGVATTDFVYNGTETGIVTVTAEYGNVDAHTYIYIVDGYSFNLQIWSSPDTIFIGSGNYSTIVNARLTDSDGIGIENEQLSFNADQGNITPLAITGNNGFAQVDYNFTGEDETTVELSVSYGGDTAFAALEVLKSDEIIMNVWADPDTIYAGTEVNYTEIYAQLNDGFGNPITEVQVDFSATIGSILGFGDTNEYGIAQTTFYYNQRPDMVSIITASYGGVSEITTVNILFNQPQIVFLEAVPLDIYNDYHEITYSTITTQILDSVGNPLSNYLVTFETNLGYLNNHHAITDNSGYASVRLHDNGIAGIATIIVQCSNDQSQIDVWIHEISKQ